MPQIELVLLAATLLLVRAIQVAWRKRNGAEVEAEAEAETEAETLALAPSQLWAQGIYDFLETAGARPEVFKLSDGNLLILTVRGNWKLYMEERRVELVAPKPHAPHPSDPPEH